MARIQKDLLGIAGEFAVASELCRWNIYAQLTLGQRKRTDLLVDGEAAMLRIQVKAKQGKSWPNCKGVHGEGIFLVFVDFAAREQDGKTIRPDFFILDANDWEKLMRTILKENLAKDESDRNKIVLDENNVPIWPNQKHYRGCGITPAQIEPFRESWDKITKLGPTQEGGKANGRGG